MANWETKFGVYRLASPEALSDYIISHGYVRRTYAPFIGNFPGWSRELQRTEFVNK